MTETLLIPALAAGLPMAISTASGSAFNADFRTAGWGQPVPGPVTGLTCDDTVSPAQLGFLHCGEIAAERLR